MPRALQTQHEIQEHHVQMTVGPVSGMQELIVTLEGKGWAITEMEVVDDPSMVADGNPPAYTRIVLSR
jgi:hypothetical protein